MKCFTNDDCQFLHSCISSKCVHDSVFSLQPVPIIIYILMPFACGLCNTTGNSMGIFKVLFVFLILKYSGSQATMFTQSMVVGASLSNFFSIINRRHPILQTSLINYNLVYVLIPCSLLGSTFGSLVGKYFPKIVQYILIMIFFGYFAYNFFRKYRQAHQKQEVKEINKNSVHPQPQISDNINIQQIQDTKNPKNHEPEQYYSQVGAQIQAYQSVKDVAQTAQKIINLSKISQIKLQNTKVKVDQKLDEQPIHNSTNLNQSLQNLKVEIKQKQEKVEFSNLENQNKEKKTSEKPQNIPKAISEPIIQTSVCLTHEEQLQKQEWIQYQKSNHVPDIFMSIGVFLIFQFLVFLVQGKLPFFQFTNCDTKYIVGIILLAVFTLIYIFFVRFYLKKRFQRFHKYEIKQQGDLGSFTQFLIVILGGFAAGFVQGCLGIGSGTFIMAVTMSLPIIPAAASAVSGYQILFIGAASLVQGYINGDVKIADTFFIIAICAVFGGLVTLGINFYLKDKNHITVSKILTFIVFLLCFMSFILVIPSAVINYQQNGWPSMVSVKVSCSAK